MPNLSTGDNLAEKTVEDIADFFFLYIHLQRILTRVIVSSVYAEIYLV